MSSEEIVQIVDQYNQPIDALPRSVMRAKKLIHRGSYILVFNQAEELFLQRRTLTKDIYPGYWTVVAEGVVQAGESYEESASRELFEELGINAPLNFLFDHFYDKEDNHVWGRVFSCHHEGPFLLQPDEVEYGEFRSIEDILTLSELIPMTPDGIEILHRLQSSRAELPD